MAENYGKVGDILDSSGKNLFGRSGVWLEWQAGFIIRRSAVQVRPSPPKFLRNFKPFSKITSLLAIFWRAYNASLAPILSRDRTRGLHPDGSGSTIMAFSACNTLAFPHEYVWMPLAAGISRTKKLLGGKARMSQPSQDELASAFTDAGHAHHDYEQVVLGG